MLSLTIFLSKIHTMNKRDYAFQCRKNNNNTIVIKNTK
nr:MAG TPA: hypothetical protein [Caudoviricetes sp.]